VQLEKQDSAVGFLAVALTLQRDHLPSMALLASIHYGKGRYHEASRLYRSAIALDPENPEYLMSLGLCRLKLKDPQGAREHLQKAADRDPQNTIILAVLGQALFELERFDTAAVVYGTAATLDPDNPSLWLNLALTLGRIDSVAKAKTALEKAIDAYQPDQIAYAYRQLGALLYNSKRFSEALLAYEKSLLLNPADLDSRFFYAAALDRLDRKKGALSAYRKFLSMVPDTPAHEQHIRAAKVRIKDLAGGSK
jgi:tetratricopeptide (TPR) repeat protein